MSFKNDKLLKKLGISPEILKQTQPPRQPKYFNKFKNNVFPQEDFNLMADLLYLPKTPNDYLYLLVVVDLHSREFDVEPLKKRDAKTVLKAFKDIAKRKHLNIPKASLSTDRGSEFKGVFQNFFRRNGIYQKFANVQRHTQQSPVESLNKELGFYINNYLNAQTAKKGVKQTDWFPAIKPIVEILNKKRKVKDENPFKITKEKPFFMKPKFRKGQIVHWALDVPRDFTSEKLNGTFRTGDVRWSVSRVKILQVIHMPNKKVRDRYVINNDLNVSYTASQLRLAKNQKREFFAVKKIIGDRYRNGKKEYLVNWLDYPIDQSTYEPEKQLIEDDLGDFIIAYDREKKAKAKTKAKLKKK